MDPLRFAIAVIPVAMYLALLGVINLRRRPFVTTGARDLATLAIGLSGLMVIGPMELFFPEGAAIRFGPWVWMLMLAFYGLCVSLVVLLMRPRLVVYNGTVDRLRPVLTELASGLDPKSRWTGDSLIIPARKVHFFMESVEWMGNVQLLAAGNRQSHDGWRLLEKSLRRKLREYPHRPNLLGVALLFLAVVMVSGSLVWLQLRQPEVAGLLREMLRL